MRISRLHTTLSDERGAVVIIVAVGLTAVIFMVAFVVDVANWKVHSRHLQLQADAAALAAAHSLGVGSCSDSLIAADAHTYGGPDASGAPALYNKQVGGTPASKMHLYINSSGYYGDAGAGDAPPGSASAPCGAGYVDIKVSETDLPWYFGGLVRQINAHARVSLLQESSANGTLPIAVPNPLPKSGAAIFINEGTGAVLGSEPLDPLPPSGSLALYVSGTSGLPLVTVAARTGVVIALSGRKSVSLSSNDLTTICQQSLTDCYDATADPPSTGLSFIRGYSTGGSGTQPSAPILRSVELFPTGACVSPYFSDGTCIYDLVARIDAAGLGGAPLPKANQIYGANGVTLDSSTDDNCNFVAGSDPCWHANITLPTNTGPQDIDITWQETAGFVQIGNKLEDCARGNKCKGDFGNAQRAFSAKDTRSGPIKALDVCTFDLDTSCTQIHDQSYPTGAQHKFAVTIGILGTLKNATSVTDPLVRLRIKSQTGQSLDCDPGYTNLKTELQLGCRPTYIPNTGSPDCTTIGTGALWPPPPELPKPWPCIAVNTGRQPNDVSAGLNGRLYQGDQQPQNCAPVDSNGHNNWHMFKPNDPTGNDGFPTGDPRILNAYITTYGAFSHVNGTSGSVPVIGFGHFYVTGYTGSGGGFDNPCNASPPTNYPGLYPDDPVPLDDKGKPDSGLIVGHFIRFVDKVGGDGTDQCNPNDPINACVIVMTK